jgi:hypothetical protein
MMRIESWRDDIEFAIASYVDDMNPELYAALSASIPEFLILLTYIPRISDFLILLFSIDSNERYEVHKTDCFASAVHNEQLGTRH